MNFFKQNLTINGLLYWKRQNYLKIIFKFSIDFYKFNLRLPISFQNYNIFNLSNKCIKVYFLSSLVKSLITSQLKNDRFKKRNCERFEEFKLDHKFPNEVLKFRQIIKNSIIKLLTFCKLD